MLGRARWSSPPAGRCVKRRLGQNERAAGRSIGPKKKRTPVSATGDGWRRGRPRRRMRHMRECALPPKQGLYDPSNEHDACGIGFVAHIKNRKSHDIVRQGLGSSAICVIAARSAPTRWPATAPASWSRFPTRFLRAECDGLGLRAAGGRRLRGRHGLPAARRRHAAAPASTPSRKVVPRGGPDPARLARRADRQLRAGLQRQADRAGDPPGLHRARAETAPTPTPSSASCSSSASRCITRSGTRAAQDADQFYIPSLSSPDHRLQGDDPGREPRRPITPTCATSGWSRRWRWCISASPPTPSRPGSWRTRSAISATTARSTPCAATSTG